MLTYLALLVLFARVDKSIDPVQLVHRLCIEAQTEPQTKKSRYIKRLTPVVSMRKTLSVELEPFIQEMLKPHFHSGGGPKKVGQNFVNSARTYLHLAIFPFLQLLVLVHCSYTRRETWLLRRAFANIIHNAMQYGKDGKYVDVTLRADETHAVVTIANYGNPIPATDLPFIFDRFYRLDKSRSLETGGTGLGLAIARSVVERAKKEGMRETYGKGQTTHDE